MLNIRRWDLVVALYVFFIAASEFLGGKTFRIFQSGSFVLNASVAIFAFPFIFTINDIIIEVYGKERARSVVRIGLVVVALIFLFSLLAIALPPSARFAGSEAAYDAVFGKSARFALASLIAFAISEFTDLFVFTRIRERMRGRALWLRNNVSNFIAQFFDTSVFISLAFYGFNQSLGANIAYLWSIILPYWTLKCVMSVIETPLVYIGVRWLRKDPEARLAAPQ